MLRDCIYPVKEHKTNEELRYSLRSLKNYKHRNVFLGGHIPDWSTMVVQCPRKKQGYSNHQNAFNNLRTILDNPGLSENIVVFNDDFFILKPIDEIPIFKGREVGFSTWKAASKHTLEVMKKMGCWSGASYEQHLPFVCQKSKLINVLDTIKQEKPEDYGRVFWRTVYGNHYRIGGTFTQDVKVRRNVSIYPDQVFISSEDTTFEQHLKPLLEPIFPNKSNYEK